MMSENETCGMTPDTACGCQNLDNREVAKRKTLAYGSMLVAFAMVAYSKIHEQPEWMSAMPAIPFFVGYLGIFQARTRTCVALAFIERDMSEGKLQPVSDRATARRLKKRSLKIVAGAAFMGALTAFICSKI